VSACLAQISMDDDELKDLTVDVYKLYEEIHGYPLRGENRKQCYADLLKLMRKRIRITSPLNPNGQHNFVWFTHIYRDEFGHKFTATINQDLIEYLINLDGNFTRTKLIDHKEAGMSYGLKLFQMMKKLNGPVREKIFSIDDLKAIFNLTGKYSRTYDFKRRVIEPAIKDINNFADFTLSYKQLKTGRSITHLKFTKHPKNKSKQKHDPFEALL
jgi:plasmid replication initiation protein